MQAKKRFKQIVVLLLAAVMLLGVALPAGALGVGEKSGFSIRKVDNAVISADQGLKLASAVENADDEANLPETVRVSIFLEAPSTIEAGYSTMGIAENKAAMGYRKSLKSQQVAVERAISARVLNGEKLDVVWNLTLAANVISANVPSAKLNEIRAVPGVKKVMVEQRYDVDMYTKEANDPSMSTSGLMVDAPTVYKLGITGAGSRIAVIDTGTDTDHQSFDGGALDYVLAKDAVALAVENDGFDPATGNVGAVVAAYRASLDLLDVTKINAVLTELNAYDGAATKPAAADLYYNTKLAFNYNYVDKGLDVTHDNDTQGEHGSHVAGIATANRYIPAGDTYVEALKSVLVQGVAPDAQLLTMKVFGKKGGAYDADYMAAIEDAILLGCDAVNLSLGSGSAGLSMSDDYQKIMDMLADPQKNPKSVVSISAGNSGGWADNSYLGTSYGLTYPYADSVNTATGGSPGSYTNSLCVASVDNIGTTGHFLTFSSNSGDKSAKVGYTESSYKNRPFVTLDTTGGKGTTLNFVFTDGIGSPDDYAAMGDAIVGSVVLCKRGTLSFYEKAENACRAGAVATIIYNNQSGVINPDLSDYSFTAPVVTITQADGAAIKALATPVTDKSGKVLYYTGKITVVDGSPEAAVVDEAARVMSSFSSWGVPGSLTLKPEITAPGGNIYSVNGAIAGGDSYENMSGTSMAAPQITGMAALVGQYIRKTGLDGYTGFTQRQLAQSLLMSTAVPMIEDESGCYYPVLRQGSGLANVGAAVTASSFIMMGEDATASAADGKVKAELGDDKAKTGEYSFTFTVYNLSDDAATYLLDADMFTQDQLTRYGMDFMASRTCLLEDAEVTFEGDDVNDDGILSLAPADRNGPAYSVVTANIDLTGCEELLAEYPAGAFIEGYVYVIELVEDDDELAPGDVWHTIPVLGYYGSWTDPSMYEVGSPVEFAYGLEDRLPYIYSSTGLNDETNYLAISYHDMDENAIMMGNPYGLDDEYKPIRNAMNNENGDKIANYTYSLVRNAGSGMMVIYNARTGQIYGIDTIDTPIIGAYYYVNGGSWQNTKRVYDINTTLAGLREGTTVRVSLIMIPEYYGQLVEGTSGSYLAYFDQSLSILGKLGDGAYLDTLITIDNTAPELDEESVDIDMDNAAISFTAQDNQYIAAIRVYNEDGSRLVTEVLPNQTTANTAYDCEIDMDGAYGTKFLVALYDYARNCSTYEITLDKPFDGNDHSDELLILDSDMMWSSWDGEGLTDVVEATSEITAAVYADGYIFAVDAANNLCVANPVSLDTMKVICNLGVPVSDMAYDAKTGTIYGLVGGYLVTIDKLTGEIDVVGAVDLEYANYVGGLGGLALDDKGNFYTIYNVDLSLYTFKAGGSAQITPTRVGAVDRLSTGYSTLLWNPTDKLLYTAQVFTGFSRYDDITGDRKVDEKDAQMILDYRAEKLEDTSVFDEYELGDFSNDGKVTTYDAHVILAALGQPETINLITVNPKTGAATDLCELDAAPVSLVRTYPCDAPDWAGNAEVTDISVDPTSATLIVGESTQLTAYLIPWTAASAEVTWTSSDEDVATVTDAGLVTGVGKGEATITASCGGDIEAQCVVTVKTVNYTAKGILMNSHAEFVMFDYNLENARTWTEVRNLGSGGDLCAVTKSTDGDSLYTLVSADSSFVIKKLDAATGAEKSEASLGDWPMTSIASCKYLNTVKNTDLVIGIYGPYVFVPFDPNNFEKTFNGYYNLTPYLSQVSGGTQFVAVDSLGYYEEDGDEFEMFVALDDKGYVWFLTFVNDEEEGLSLDSLYCSDTSAISSLRYGQYACSSLYACDEDGDTLFMTYVNEDADTSEMFMLTYADTDSGYTYVCRKVTGFGSSVWPACLYEVTENAPASAGGASLRGKEPTLVTVPKMQEKLTPSTDKQGVTGETVAQTSVKVDVSVTASTNGLVKVDYNSKVLTLDTVADNDLALISINGETAGTVLLAYADAEEVEGTLATLHFTYDPNKVPDTTAVTITSVEDGSEAPNARQKVTITFREVVREPVVPSEPADETPETPETPDDNTKVEENEDGSVTTTVTGEDGTVTATTETTDGTKVVKTTAPDGDTVITVTQPDGQVVVSTRIPSTIDTSDKEGFIDVPEGHWAEDAINNMAALGLVKGVNEAEHIYDMTSSVTRGTMATLLFRLSHGPTGMDNPFKDVADGVWYTDGVAWASKAGVVTGYTADTFGPEDVISREQMAVMLYRYAKLIGVDLTVKEGALDSFTDAEETSGWALDAVAWAVSKGLLNGKGGSILDPKGEASRAEVATVLDRFVNLMR